MDIAYAPAGRRTRTRTSSVPLAAAAWSAATGALGLWWSSRPEHYPFPPDPGTTAGTLLDVVPPALVPPALVAAGAVGLGAAALARAGWARRVVLLVAAAWFAVFGLAVPGLRPLVLAGYLMAVFGPVVLFATVLTGAWRWRGGPLAVGAFVLVGSAAWGTGLADGDVVRRYLAVLGSALPRTVPPLFAAFFLTGGLMWAVLGARTALGDRTSGQLPAWMRPDATARWGRTATFVAAACALPYGLLRLTWLTPWPFGIDPAALAAAPEMRLHGLLLGLAALAGAVLTTGLVARWGEVWPCWVPVVRGRAVPPAAAVVPGAVVAALFTVAAVPMVVITVASGDLFGLVVFPFFGWGPALAIAVLGYALRRAGGAPDGAGTIGGS
ncbi:MAG TPA: hypothetical protein VKZ81_30275 [Pseudonocardia sp.]|uniref:hypothetical protein n=1 Tax=Pseudonocardia sp. TaxID=60912 RepID=UPI002B4AB348|nr:hypothetical protein [Pseudonocardia sp.]HLU59768.1 hypothetical protein [Pseudonocardia sp.]